MDGIELGEDLIEKTNPVLFNFYTKCFGYGIRWLELDDAELCHQITPEKYWYDANVPYDGYLWDCPKSINIKYELLAQDFGPEIMVKLWNAGIRPTIPISWLM